MGLALYGFYNSFVEIQFKGGPTNTTYDRTNMLANFATFWTPCTKFGILLPAQKVFESKP